MKTSEIAVEAITKLNELMDTLLYVENADIGYTQELTLYAKYIKNAVFGHIVKYEYSELYMKHKKKLNPNKFIENPKKTLKKMNRLIKRN